MPLKRSSETSAQDQLILIRSLTKSLCSSPEETDLKRQSLLHQEDDSGIKSGNLDSAQEFVPACQSNSNLQFPSFFFFLCFDAL